MNNSDLVRTPDGRWRKGCSGNPAGKPPGTRSRTARLVAALLAENAEALTRAVVAKALEGDRVAQRLCIDRMLPPLRDLPVELDLAFEPSKAGAAAALGRTLAAMGAGEITPEEAATVAQVIEARRRSVQKLWDDDLALAAELEEGDAELEEGDSELEEGDSEFEEEDPAPEEEDAAALGPDASSPENT